LVLVKRAGGTSVETFVWQEANSTMAIRKGNPV